MDDEVKVERDRKTTFSNPPPVAPPGLYSVWTLISNICRRMPRAVEFAIVILVAFGVFAYGAFISWCRGSGDDAITNADLSWLVTYELIAFLIIVTFLRARQWKPSDFHPQVTWKLTGAGVLLTLGAVLYSTVVATGLGIWFESPPLETGQLDFGIVLLFSVVNGIYEETFVVGYVVGCLARQSNWVVIISSALIRFSYHVYQGPEAVLFILPMGLAFAYLYVKYRRLWPLVLCHIILSGIEQCFHSLV
jgi:membrane protease YdiL (CAAX protease family)